MGGMRGLHGGKRGVLIEYLHTEIRVLAGLNAASSVSAKRFDWSEGFFDEDG